MRFVIQFYSTRNCYQILLFFIMFYFQANLGLNGASHTFQINKFVHLWILSFCTQHVQRWLFKNYSHLKHQFNTSLMKYQHCYRRIFLPSTFQYTPHSMRNPVGVCSKFWLVQACVCGNGQAVGSYIQIWCLRSREITYIVSRRVYLYISLKRFKYLRCN